MESRPVPRPPRRRSCPVVPGFEGPQRRDRSASGSRKRRDARTTLLHTAAAPPPRSVSETPVEGTPIPRSARRQRGPSPLPAGTRATAAVPPVRFRPPPGAAFRAAGHSRSAPGNHDRLAPRRRRSAGRFGVSTRGGEQTDSPQRRTEAGAVTAAGQNRHDGQRPAAPLPVPPGAAFRVVPPAFPGEGLEAMTPPLHAAAVPPLVAISRPSVECTPVRRSERQQRGPSPLPVRTRKPSGGAPLRLRPHGSPLSVSSRRRLRESAAKP